MSWMQSFANWAVAGTFVGLGLGVMAYFNGKHIKDGVAELKELLRPMAQTLQGIQQTLQRMERTQEAVQQTLHVAIQMLERMDARAETHHQEILKKLA